MTEPEKLQLETMAEMWRNHGRDIYVKFFSKSPSASEAVEAAFIGCAEQLEKWIKKARVE